MTEEFLDTPVRSPQAIFEQYDSPAPFCFAWLNDYITGTEQQLLREAQRNGRLSLRQAELISELEQVLSSMTSLLRSDCMDKAIATTTTYVGAK